MVRIEPVTAHSPPAVLEAARLLLRAYAEFLRQGGSNALFSFSRLEGEITNPQLPYTESNGELLLAMDEFVAVGCIAYRSLGEPDSANCCEIKRLFVTPAARRQGLGKRLVSLAIERARQRGYQAACLDTEPQTMAVAKGMYLDLGFTNDEERSSTHKGEPVIFLKKSLST